MLAGRMSLDQEAAVKATIIKAAGKKTIVNFPEVTEAMESWYPCTGDLKFLILLEEICNGQERHPQEILQAAQGRIRKVGRMSDHGLAIL